ncbi:hypothetical protein IGI01_18780 [Bacillus thuringiensis]|nr:hypothetical protein [Bacillus thuringiensis]
MQYKADDPEFLNEKPELTEEILRSSIMNNWKKYTIVKMYSLDEVTYLLFDNLYRVIKDNSKMMEITYDTLIDLNAEEGNQDMVKHLEHKKNEYFETFTKPYIAEIDRE